MGRSVLDAAVGFPYKSECSEEAEGAYPSAGANGPLPFCFRLLNPTFSLYENI
jgi:hypothetical protein